MAFELLIAPEASRDIEEAYDWYEICRFGLGEEFLNCVDACIQRIHRSPETYPKIFENYRRALLRRFPYVVFYEYNDTTITVYSFFHTSQNPDKWRSRLSS